MNSGKNINSIVKKAMKGNAKAYGQLIEMNKEYLYRTAYLQTKNEQDALDAVGDCILNGFKSIKTLQRPEYFKTWITRILYNAVCDSFKKNFRVLPSEHIEETQAVPDPMLEEKGDLYNAIDVLSEKYRIIIILKYFNELKISEIAYAMDIPEGSVKAYLSRAKNELRKILKEGYFYAI